MQQYISSLESICTVAYDRLNTIPRALILTFSSEDVVTTIRVHIRELSEYRYLEITHTTTHPIQRRREGFGSRAVEALIAWAKNQNMERVEAVSVLPESECFWERHGFKEVSDIMGVYQRKL